MIQFREEEAKVDYLRSRGVNPNEFAREAFDQALRIARAEERFQKIRELRVRIPPDVDIVKLIREDRER